jgi:beta-barrel assembly-enhancing protease
MRGSFSYIIALLIAGFSLLTYWCKREKNEITGEVQHIDMTVDQEIAPGLQVAAPMEQVGQRLVEQTKAGASRFTTIRMVNHI